MGKRKAKQYEPEEIRDEQLFAYLDGWEIEAGGDDLPDGAWQAVMEEGVAAYNESCGTNYDTHDGWQAWIESRGE